GQPGAVHACRKEHGMAEAEQPCIAKEHVVGHGEYGQDHDARHQAVMIGRQHEMEREQRKNDCCVEQIDPQRRNFPRHRAVAPNRPCGRNTSTSATASVATILASVGEKNIEIMPSDRPISIAATTVPRSEPRPPMMTTMKDRSSGSCPIR